jgi:CheY-like chemotaxis protein
MVPEAVEDAASALVRLRSAAAEGQPFDIAILDLLMPDMDGLQLAQHKSADRELDHTRMIMLTSTAHVDSAALASAGIAQWCTKPVRTSVLYDRLMRLMTVGRPTKATTKPTVVPAATAGSRGRILVAEDNELNQLVAEGLVGRLGFDVEIVANGVEALQALARNSYSAVMMDCHMPVMDGFEATRRIRAGETGAARTPIIAMTAGALDEDRKRCLEAGMDDFVTKPVDIAALERALALWAVEHV